MKHFLPSSVMLMPFVVKHYPDDENNEQESCEQSDVKTSESQLDLSTEHQKKENKVS